MRNPSLEHQKLIKAAIDTFMAQGFTILVASYGDFTDPGKHGRHEPDIEIRDSKGILHLVEAKLGSDLQSPTTKEQLKDFSRRIMLPSSSHPGEVVPFHIIVYREDVPDLLKLLESLNLDQLLNKRIFIHWLEETR